MKLLHELSMATVSLSKKLSSFSEVAVSLLRTCTAPTSVQQVIAFLMLVRYNLIQVNQV